MPATSQELGAPEQKRINLRIDEELVESFDEAVENRSEALRELMRETVNQHNDDDHDLQLPSNPKARTGLKVLAEHAHQWEDGWIVDIPEVRPAIRDEANVSDGSLRRKVFHPLKDGDYIKPAGCGKFEVHPKVVEKYREGHHGN